MAAEECKTARSHWVIQFYGQRRKWGEFSNFYAAPITLKGKEWPTTEHYFQVWWVWRVGRGPTLRAVLCGGEDTLCDAHHQHVTQAMKFEGTEHEEEIRTATGPGQAGELHECTLSW